MISQPAKQGPLPTDFVVLIDNSGSIRPQEQILVRETTMLLADLADVGDGISVITFGRDFRVIPAVRIRNDDDRVAFRQRVRAGVDFVEQFSDIRAGIRALAQNQDSLFRPAQQSNRAAIVLTDGKLEPADGRTQEAFEEIQADVKGPLAGTNIYAVVLGNTTSQDIILQLDGADINGQKLMREYIASSADRYFHAQQLDQLLDVGVVILNKAKGISSFGERGATQFRIDDTVESMSLIVRRRSTDGTILCQSSDIELKWPGAQPATVQNAANLFGSSVYWNREYEYFDLVVVRRPQQGIWEVRLANGKTPEVLSKIITPIELRSSKRELYYINEVATLGAWLFDRRDMAISRAPYKIQARLAADGKLSPSNPHVLLHTDTATGQYVLEVPTEINRVLNRPETPGTVSMELIAEKRRSIDSEEIDPWFIRRSGPFNLELAEPFIQWAIQKQQLTKVPLFGSLISYPNPFAGRSLVPFGGVIDPSKKYYPAFLVPPRLTVSVQRFDEASHAYKPLGVEKSVEATSQKTRLAYALDSNFRGTGNYRYSYRLAGNTDRGAFNIQSPWYVLKIRYGWEFLGLFGVVFFGSLCALSSRTAKLGGQLTTAAPNFRSQPLRKRVETVQDQGIHFQLSAVRSCFFRNRISLSMIKGRAIVDGRRIPEKGQISLLPRKRHKVTFIGENGSQVQKEIQARVRMI